MSRIVSFLLFSVITGLIFLTGCSKDQPSPDPDTQKPAEVKVDPAETKEPQEPKQIPPTDEKTSEDKTGPDKSDKVEKNEIEDKAEVEWMTDFKAAKKKAAEENKDLLINFSGSDWCIWCIRLDKEVFSNKEFYESASKDFVFVLLDFPRDTSDMSPQLLNQNEELRVKYGPEGFPSVILANAQGDPYALTGYQEGGPEAYLAHLKDFKQLSTKIEELVAKAENSDLDNTEKAKLLDESIQFYEPVWVFEFYRDRIEKIVELDSENTAGLRNKHAVNLALMDASMLLSESKVDQAIALIDKAITDLKLEGVQAQEAYFYKAQILFEAKNDRAGSLENLKKSIKAAPDSEFAAYLQRLMETQFPETAPKPEKQPDTNPDTEKIADPPK